MLLFLLLVISCTKTTDPATSNTAPGVFTRYSSNPVYTPTGYTAPSSAPWNMSGIGDPSVIYDSSVGLYKMWTSAAGVVPPRAEVIVRTQYLTSTDGAHWTEYTTNPVFKEGGSSDWDYGGVETVSVLKSNNVYWLWYAGYPVRSSSLPLNLKIGAATSNDGITWTRASTSPVLDKGSPGAWDDGWVESPTVIQVNGTFYMWYTGVSTSLNFQIGLAASSDGINWTKQPTPVLSANPANAWENGGVYAPSVIWDGTHIIMWYVGFNSSTFLNATQIGMATSTDGINWTRSTLNPVLGLGQSGSFDEKGPFVPSVLQKDGQYQMWYLRGNSGQEKVGFATATEISGN